MKLGTSRATLTNSLAALWLLLAQGCSDSAPVADGSATVSSTSSAPTEAAAPATASAASAETHASAGTAADAPQSAREFQAELLRIAGQVGAALPLEPHVKARSAVQAAVVEACLDVGLDDLALEIGKGIENWRKGQAYALVAQYRVKHGDERDVQPLLDVATAESIAALEQRHRFEPPQEWRRDFVQAIVAQTQLLMGQTELALRFGPEAEPSEADKLEIARCMLVTKQGFAAQTRALDAILDSKMFDRMRHAMDGYLILYERFYAESEFREQVERTLESTINVMPTDLRFQTLADLARIAGEQGDKEKSLELAQDALTVFEGARWLPEVHVRMLATLAELKILVGELGAARTILAEAEAHFRENRESTVDIDRPEPLFDVAAAYARLGDQATARRVYALGFDEAFVNPNGKPRAEDLAAGCCSMARAACEPDSDLWAKIRKQQGQLAAPW